MKKINVILALLILFFSCKKDSQEDIDIKPGPAGFVNGVFIVNEGNFGSNQGDVSYVGSNGSIINEMYFENNNVVLGDVLQSFSVIGSKGYAVVNNSSKIEVVDMANFGHLATIANVDYPRYLLPVNSTTAYLTSGSMSGQVKVLDLNTNTFTNSIAVGNGPDHLIMANNRVFVCNNGGFLSDSTLSVINTATHSLEASIEVGDMPNNIVKDAIGHLWVLCSGKTIYDVSWNVIGNSAAELFEIDPVSLAVVGQYPIGQLGDHPTKMAVSSSGSEIYFENHGVYHFNINQPGTFDLIISGDHGALGVHPNTDHLWVGSVSNFTSGDTIFEYNGPVLMHHYLAGVGANSIVFN